MRESKTASIAIIISFVVTVGLVLIMLFKTSGETEKRDYELISVSIVNSNVSQDGAKYYISGHFSTKIAKNELLYFYPCNIWVKFWLNKELVYEFGGTSKNTMSTPGHTIAMLDLGEVSTTDTVEFELYDPWYGYEINKNAIDKFLNSFVIGDEQSIYQYLLHDKWVGIIVSVLMMFMGIAFLVYTLIYYFGHYIDADINIAFFLLTFTSGTFLLLFSLGNMLPLLMPNPLWCSMLKIISHYIMFAAIVSYLHSCAGHRVVKEINFVMSMISWVLIILVFLSELIGVSDMYSTCALIMNIQTAILLISVITSFVGMIVNSDFQTRRFFISMIPIVICALFTMYINRDTKIPNYDVAYLGALIASMVLGVGIASDARVAQLSIAWMNKEIIHKREQLDQAFEYISETKRRTAKLVSENELLEMKNNIDVMTGLFNKVAMNKFIADHLENSNNSKSVLIFIDLDHFKSLNDTLGHDTGDVAIKEAGQKLRNSFRQYDLVGRFGGDEFCVFIKSIDRQPLISKLNALVEVLKASYTNGTDTINITASIGCAYCLREKIEFDKLFKIADSAVYEAKEGGRNQFVLKLIK